MSKRQACIFSIILLCFQSAASLVGVLLKASDDFSLHIGLIFLFAYTVLSLCIQLKISRLWTSLHLAAMCAYVIILPKVAVSDFLLARNTAIALVTCSLLLYIMFIHPERSKFLWVVLFIALICAREFACIYILMIAMFLFSPLGAFAVMSMRKYLFWIRLLLLPIAIISVPLIANINVIAALPLEYMLVTAGYYFIVKPRRYLHG